MHLDKWERVKDGLSFGARPDSGERAAFIEEVCKDDPEVLREVESLLAEAGDDSFLEQPAWQAAEHAGAESGPREPVAGTERPADPQARDSSNRRRAFLSVVWLAVAAVVATFGYAAWRCRERSRFSDGRRRPEARCGKLPASVPKDPPRTRFSRVMFFSA